ncbi:Nischarin-like Protein [Tribolium castaneum]|uniref:Nischarin-like Protein n=1 Tax=Tribolium castaneum TaxID=7070 RepID=D6W751_TRICA|nr:Nischarin-like Protein [Tribolium castaneum]
MACFWFSQNDTRIEIPNTEEINNITYYKIVVTVGEIKWHVLHRYSEFFDLHNQLVTDHGVSKDILPSKKVIRNKCPVFIENRRKASKRDILLSSSKSYTLTPLELHAVSECLKKPFPPIENTDSRYDFTHVLDLYSQLKVLTINGSGTPYLNSNIIPNQLPFELASFKELTSLVLVKVSLDKITSLGNLRSTLQKLYVHNTNMSNISQILQCDVLHKCTLDTNQIWTNVTVVNLTNNNLIEIDKTISLVPNLKTLILDSNKISCISGLAELSNLSHLSLSNNLISMCNQLHTKIGNILTLNLSQNSISSLKGFRKLYSLVTLDLSCNKIDDIDEITYLGDLPCLENLVLTGNCVATTIDYRIKVLEHFKDRAKDICLDNEKPTQSELDKVSVLRALRIVKEGKAPDLTNYAYI